MRRTTTGPIKYYLYITGLATSLCGLCALSNGLSDKSFALFAAVMLCIAYGTSILLRKSGYTTRLLELAVVAVAVIIYLQIVAGRDFGTYLFPSVLDDTPELKLATILLWLEVLRSFTLVSDESVLFSAIPAVVMISLASTNNLNSEIMAFFILYLVLAVFLLAHRSGATRTTPRRSFRLALGTALVALIIGCAVVVPVKIICTTAFAKATPNFSRLKERSMAGFASSDQEYLQIAQGPVHLSHRVVMTVQVDTKDPNALGDLYWRGRVFDTYTGHGWESSSRFEHPTQPVKVTDKTGRIMWVYKTGTKSYGRQITQHIHNNRAVDSVIYGAAEPSIITAPTSNIRNDEFNCWQGYLLRLPNRDYDVVSELPIVTPKLLREVRLSDYDREANQNYLAIQWMSNEREQAGDLAWKITKNISRPYDKALAIERYLGQNYTYDLNAPPVPSGARDAVNYFLFKSKRGYCDIFASSMVVMCRQINLPTRLVTGFITGEYDPKSKGYVVRESDRHAWAEVYFPECGWVTFDPTSWTVEGDNSWTGIFNANLKKMISDIMGGTAALPLTITLLAGCAVIAFSGEIRRLLAKTRSGAPSRLHAAAVRRYRSICRSTGVREQNLTPFETVELAAELPLEAKSAAMEAMELFTRLRYSSKEITESDIRELDRLHNGLKDTIKRARRTAH